MSLNATNSTSIPPSSPLATAYAAWIMIPITLTTLILNILLIVVYFRFPYLQTPFAVYIIGLVAGDLAQTLTVHIHSIFTLLPINWPLGQPFCTFILYSIWVFVPFSYHMHILICINRVWAVAFPAHYRLRHNKKVAVLLVLGMFWYVNLWILPGFCIHVLHYSGTDGIPVCMPSYPNELLWSNMAFTCLYFVPELVLLALYPVVLIKGHRTAKRKIHARSVSNDMSRSKTLNAVPGRPLHSQSGSVATSRQQATAQLSHPRRHFAVLTALVMMAVVCWTPVDTAYAMVHYGWIPDNTIMTPFTIIFFMDALLNPVIFLVASREWRKALGKLFRL